MPKTITFTDEELETLSDMALDAQYYRDGNDGHCRDCDKAQAEAQEQEPGRFDAANAKCVDHVADRETADDDAALAEKIENA